MFNELKKLSNQQSNYANRNSYCIKRYIYKNMKLDKIIRSRRLAWISVIHDKKMTNFFSCCIIIHCSLHAVAVKLTLFDAYYLYLHHFWNLLRPEGNGVVWRLTIWFDLWSARKAGHMGSEKSIKKERNKNYAFKEITAIPIFKGRTFDELKKKYNSLCQSYR